MAYKGRKEKSNDRTIPIAKTGTAEKAAEMHKDSQLSQPGDEEKVAIQVVRNEQDKADSHEVTTSEKEKEHNLDV